jgi:predicted enzyme related to lactoylglutathione lyase
MSKMVVGYVNIGVRDFKAALVFYRDVLGLPVSIADEAFSYARFDTGAVPFAIAGGGEDKGGVREDKHTGIGFCVDDVDAAHRELAAKGVRFTMLPSKQPWGGYMALFADPDGNVFYLDTPPEQGK